MTQVPRGFFLRVWGSMFSLIIYFELFLHMGKHKGLSEHGPRMESWEAISVCLWENAKKARQEPCEFSFFKNMALFLDCFWAPPRCSRQQFASAYSLQLATAIGSVSLWKDLVLPCVACPCECTLYSWDSSYPESRDWLMLWMELAIACNFSLPHLSAQASQLPLCLEQCHRPDGGYRGHQSTTASDFLERMIFAWLISSHFLLKNQ